MNFPLPAFPLQQQCFSLMSSSYLKIMLVCFWILYRESRMNLCVNTLGVIILNLLYWINQKLFFFFLCPLCLKRHLSICFVFWSIHIVLWNSKMLIIAIIKAVEVFLSPNVNWGIMCMFVRGIFSVFFFMPSSQICFGTKKCVAVFTLKSCVFVKDEINK